MTPRGVSACKKIEREADRDGNGHLEFQEFLFLMRAYTDEKEEEALRKETEAVHGSGYSAKQVEARKGHRDSGEGFWSDREIATTVFRPCVSLVWEWRGSGAAGVTLNHERQSSVTPASLQVDFFILLKLSRSL